MTNPGAEQTSREGQAQRDLVMQTWYIYTLDSHDCYGPFVSPDAAHAWAAFRNKTSYQLLTKPPYEYTLVHGGY